MWKADYISYNGNTSYIAAYQGKELLWKKAQPDYFWIENISDIEVTVYLTNMDVAVPEGKELKDYSYKYNNGTWYDYNNEMNFEYSLDGGKTWKSDSRYTSGSHNGYRANYFGTIKLKPNDRLYVRGHFTNGSITNRNGKYAYDFPQFQCQEADGRFKIGGDLYTIINYKAKPNERIIAKYGMFGLFNSLQIVDASESYFKNLVIEEYGLFETFTWNYYLEKSPIFDNIILGDYALKNLFKKNTSLNEITCLNVTFGENSTEDWVLNVAETGTFIKQEGIEWSIGVNGIPEGWVIKNYGEPDTPDEDPADDITLPYVTFRAEEAGSRVSLSYRHPNHTLEYSTDKINWSAFVTSPTGWTSIRLANIGDEVYVRGKLTANAGISSYTQFNIRYGKVAAYGNCNAIWNYEDLNAPLLYDGCGYCLFQNCLALTKAPKLPATTLTNSCYQSMFDNCPALINVPELPATKLVTACYANMFMDCTSLQEITCLATDISADKCLTGWVIRVSPTGTFYKDPSLTSWPTGTSGIPEGWTVLDYTA